MTRQAKTQQLQIRVSPEEKARILDLARRDGISMSAWILSKVRPPESGRFQSLLEPFSQGTQSAFVFAELNDFLTSLSPAGLRQAVAESPRTPLSDYQANYVAAMVEYATHRKHIDPPAWVAEIAPLRNPVFGTDLKQLRLHLLTHSPPPFRRRNIFIDTSLGGRV